MSDPVLAELSSGRLAGKALPHWGILLALRQICEEQRQLLCWLLSGHSLSPAPASSRNPKTVGVWPRHKHLREALLQKSVMCGWASLTRSCHTWSLTATAGSRALVHRTGSAKLGTHQSHCSRLCSTWRLLTAHTHTFLSCSWWARSQPIYKYVAWLHVLTPEPPHADGQFVNTVLSQHKISLRI